MNKTLAFFVSTILGLSFASLAQAATLTGTIKYEGKVPKFEPIQMQADAVCMSHHSEPVMPDTLVLGEGNTLGNVFIYVKSGLAKKDYPAPTQEALLDQKGCQYVPHVLGVQVGQKVKILNPDGTLHNVHILSKVNQEENIAMPKFRKEIEKVFAKEEFMFPVKCDVHPWMGAYVTVLSHPFFATTTKDGNFSINNLEPGTYEIEAWHEKLGTKTASITIATPDESKTQDFTFTRPGKEGEAAESKPVEPKAAVTPPAEVKEQVAEVVAPAQETIAVTADAAPLAVEKETISNN